MAQLREQKYTLAEFLKMCESSKAIRDLVEQDRVKSTATPKQMRMNEILDLIDSNYDDSCAEFMFAIVQDKGIKVVVSSSNAFVEALVVGLRRELNNRA